MSQLSYVSGRTHQRSFMSDSSGDMLAMKDQKVDSLADDLFMKYIGVLRDTARAPKPPSYHTIHDRESYDDRKCDNDRERYRVPRQKWPFVPFSAQRTNGCFSVIRTRNGPTLVQGHFFGKTNDRTKFH